jgi:hypothetical protein
MTNPLTTITSTTVIVGSANYPSPLTITSTGGVTAGVSAVALSMSVAGTVTNAGKLYGGTGATRSYHEFADQGNAGATGVQLSAGTLANTGTLMGGTGGIVYTYYAGSVDGTGGAGLTQTGGFVTNSAVISGGTGGSGNYYTIHLATNIRDAVNGGTGGAGAVISGGTFVNTGTIKGGAGGAAFNAEYDSASDGATGIGVSLTGGLLVDNGVISGSSAVVFGGTASATLLVESAASFTGKILANGDANATLALGGSTAFQLSGLDGAAGSGTFLGFQNIGFASTLSGFGISGNAAGLASGASITGFISGDTIQLTGFTATSEAWSAGKLTLGNGAATQTLAISASADQFAVLEDGTNSSIFLSPASVSFATGKIETLSAHTGGLTATTLTSFVTGDAIILEDFAATSELWASGKLTLANGAATETLSLSASSDNFAVLSNGTTSSIGIAPSSINLGGGNFILAGHGAGLTGATIASFGLGDTINLEGFAATSASFAAGTGLVLSNGVTTQTLQLSLPAGTYISMTTDGINTTITGTPQISLVSTSIVPGITMDLVTSPYHTQLTVSGSGAISGAAGVNQSGTNGRDGAAGGKGGTALTGGAGDMITNAGIVGGGAGGVGQDASYSGGTGGDGGDGADNLSGGTLANSGTISGGAGGKGGATYSTRAGTGGTGGTGVKAAAGETIINTGTIAGGAGGLAGTYVFSGGQPAGGSGGAGGTGLYVSGSSVNNSGLITGGNGQTGAQARASGSGAQGAGGAGLYATGNSVLTNTGIILGGNPGAVGPHGNYGYSSPPGTGGAGIFLNGGTLFNAGSIAGGTGADAVKFGTAAGTLVIEAGAHFTGAVEANAAAADWLEFASGSSLGLGASFTGFSKTEILSAAIVTLSGTLGSTVENDGTIVTPDGTSLVISGALTGTGVIIDDPSTIVLNGSVSSGQTISFDGPGGVIELGDATQFNGTIASFGAGDTLTIDAFTISAQNYAAGQLILNGTNAGTAETLTIHLAGSFTTSEFTFSSNGAGGTDIIPCFLAGTHIATPQGETPVESLAVGDMVLTADGRCAPVRWIGRRNVATRFARHALPIRIQAGALGEGLPRRDLLVSPDHAMYFAGILVQAGALVNGATIIRETNMPEHFTYYHVEVAAHELILAEGAATETFIDNADRMNFDNWAAYLARHGDAPPIAELPYPRAKSARQVPASLRRRLQVRAA